MGNSFAESCTIFASYFIFIFTFPISIFFCLQVVSEYERGVLFRLGKLKPGGPVGPGLILALPCIDTFILVDLRIVTSDVQPQEVLSKDSVTVTVDAVLYYKIFDPLNAVIQVSNYSYSTGLLAATVLRNVLGTKSLSDILSERTEVASAIRDILDKATDPWGVQVLRVEIKDVRLPFTMQRAMAAEAAASREARAKVIAAEGELRASKALKAASDIITTSPTALQTIKEYERIIIYRLGHLKKPKPLGPGMIFILPCVDKFFILDLRVVTFDVPPQEILTKDSVTIYVEAVVYFKISNPLLAVQCVTNYNHSTRILAGTTLRNVLGSKQLTQVLSEKEAIANEVFTILDEVTIHWGVYVTHVEIKDVSLPISMQRAMAAEGEATRDATANVIFAEGEFEAAAALKEASDIIGPDNNTAIQLRYLHTLTHVAVERNSTVLFPIPSKLLKKLCNLEEPDLPTMETKASGPSEIDIPTMVTTASGPSDCGAHKQ